MPTTPFLQRPLLRPRITNLKPSLLSLEAPLVAVLWFRLIAHVVGLRDVAGAQLVLALAVWIIYCADRLLDAASGRAQGRLEEFCRRHTTGLLAGLAAAAVAEAYLVQRWLPSRVQSSGIFVGAAVAAYFLLVHATSPAFVRRWPKELLVGILFSAGVCFPIQAWMGGSQKLVNGFFLLASVATLNCAAVKGWAIESAPHLHRLTQKIRDRWTWMTWGLAGLTMLYQALVGFRPLFTAAGLSAAGLALLPVVGRRWPSPFRIVAVDAVLCSPFLLPIFWK